MIELINDLYIDADENQYILIEKGVRTNKETGEQTDKYNALGYYTSLGGAIKGAVKHISRRGVSLDRLITLQDAIAELKAIEARLMALAGEDS